MSEVIAVIGHNNPPSESEIVTQRLEAHENEKKIYVSLSSKIIPAEITTDDEAGNISDHIKAIRNLDSSIDEIHKKEKKPYLDAGRAADEWKNAFKLKTENLVKKASPVLLAWNKKKEEAERQRLLEIAKKAREDAEKLAAEALAHEAEGINDTAEDLMNAAIVQDSKAELIESGNYAVKAVSRGSFSSSGIKRKWVGKIESMAVIDLEVLRPYLKEDDVLAALNRAVTDGKRDIKGAILEQEEKLSSR